MTERVKLKSASNMVYIKKERRAGSTYAPGVTPRIMEQTVHWPCQKKGQILQGFVTRRIWSCYSQVPWRNHMAPALPHYHMTLELKGFVTNFANFCIFSNTCFCVDVFNMYCSLSLSWRTQRIFLDGYVVSVFSRLWYSTVSSVLQIREAFFHYLCVYLTWICIFSLILELIFFFSWLYTPKFAYLMNFSASFLFFLSFNYSFTWSFKHHSATPNFCVIPSLSK